MQVADQIVQVGDGLPVAHDPPVQAAAVAEQREADFEEYYSDWLDRWENSGEELPEILAQYAKDNRAHFE